MNFEVIQPDGMPAPSGFSYAVSATGQKLLFIGGHTAQDSTGGIVGAGDIVKQFERVSENIAKTLKAGGGVPENMTKMTIYVTSIALYRENLRPIGSLYRRHFGRHYPAMTLVEVSRLFDREAMIEIDAIALIPQEAL